MKKRPHYYYAIAEDTHTGKRIQEFMNECEAASERARQWAMAHGATGYYESPNGMAGGVCAVEFDNTIAKEGWEKIEAQGCTFWMPESGSQLEKEMCALPVVSEMALIGILELKQPVNANTGAPLPFTFGDETPVVFRYAGTWYADVPYLSQSADCSVLTKTAFSRWKCMAMAEKG